MLFFAVELDLQDDAGPCPRRCPTSRTFQLWTVDRVDLGGRLERREARPVADQRAADGDVVDEQAALVHAAVADVAEARAGRSCRRTPTGRSCAARSRSSCRSGRARAARRRSCRRGSSCRSRRRRSTPARSRSRSRTPRRTWRGSVSVGSAVGTVTGVTAEASVLLALPDHSTGLPGRSGSLLTIVHASGSGGSCLAPVNVRERRSRPLSTLPVGVLQRDVVRAVGRRARHRC